MQWECQKCPPSQTLDCIHKLRQPHSLTQSDPKMYYTVSVPDMPGPAGLRVWALRALPLDTSWVCALVSPAFLTAKWLLAPAMGSVSQNPPKLKSLEALQFEHNYNSPHFHTPQKTPPSTGEKHCNAASPAAPSQEAQSRAQHKPGPDTSYPRPLALSLPAKQAFGNVPLES